METDTSRELVITRIFNARRKLLWEVWNDPRHVVQWWGPEGFTTRVDKIDLRPGGEWKYVMIGPDGTEYPAKGVFQEIVPFERIVTTDEFGDGFELPDKSPLPQGIVLTCIFEDMNAKTKLTLRIMHATAKDREKHEEMGVVAGWGSSLDCLDKHLSSIGATATAPKCQPTRYVDGPELLIAGIKRKYTLESRVNIPRQWEEFINHVGQVPGQVGNVTYGVSTSADADGNFEYLTGVEVVKDGGLPQGFEQIVLHPQRYAVFTHREHISQIAHTLTDIWNSWLPNSGCQIASTPCFERYDEHFDPNTGTGDVEIWIPITQ